MHISLARPRIHFVFSLIFYIAITALLLSCSKEEPVNLETGNWHAQLFRNDGHHVPFTFKLSQSGGHPIIEIINAKENLKVDSIQQKGDSLFITMPLFDSNFKLKIENSKKLTGTWTKYYKDYEEKMPFEASLSDTPRLKTYQKPNKNITGNWDTEFPNGELNDLSAIGAFQQKDNIVTGTFLTPAGDFRYLEGVVSGDTLKLSGFDGGHASLWTAIIKDSLLTNGNFYSINQEPIKWESVKSKSDELPASYAVNTIASGKIKADISFKDMRTNQVISLEDENYQDKVVIIDLLGSWCPNCYDETKFLIDYYHKNKDRGVEIIGLDFERSADEAKAKKLMNNSFFKRFDIPYPVLFSGISSTDRGLTDKLFPGLPQKIRAFPTLIFVDKTGYIRKIHSGFNGPATGKYYDEFIEEFEGIVSGLLNE